MNTIVSVDNSVENTSANQSANANSTTSNESSTYKYKNLFYNDNGNSNKNNMENVNLLLDKESKQNKNESWNKLDKTAKIKLLNNYVELITPQHNLSAQEITELKLYLTDSLDKKKLQHVKDVHCDKITGKIISIPTLHFTTTSRKFTLKRTEKRVSTLKSLGKGKKAI